MFSDCAIRNCEPSFLEFLGQNCKTLQNHQTLQKSAEISFTIWIQLISFWDMSCVFLCIFVCLYVKCFFFLLLLFFFQVCIFVETFVRAWLSQTFVAFWSCPQYHVVFHAFVLMYDIGIKLWYVMIWYDMIWYDMIWYDMIWYDMIWYEYINLKYSPSISKLIDGISKLSPSRLFDTGSKSFSVLGLTIANSWSILLAQSSVWRATLKSLPHT